MKLWASLTYFMYVRQGLEKNLLTVSIELYEKPYKVCVPLRE